MILSTPAKLITIYDSIVFIYLAYCVWVYETAHMICTTRISIV